jgi:hypothetical protein
VSSAVVTRVQSVSRATPPTIRESVESLQARNSDHADRIGQAHLPLPFGLADAAQSVGSHNTHVDTSDPATDMVHTLASKMLHTPLFMTMEWSSSAIQPAKIFT